MQLSVKHLTGYTIVATDGALGSVSDFYLDDQAWTIRYLVVNTGAWHSGRKVLISPVALGRPDGTSRTFPVTLTRDQVRNSPSIDTDKPVSRQHEAELHRYYAWPVYWVDCPYPSGMGPAPTVPAGTPPPMPADSGIPATPSGEAPAARTVADPHLRSSSHVMGYDIQATDGEVGHVRDFILDDESWAIRYLVVDTGRWLPGRKVLVAPAWIERVSWLVAKIFFDLSREAIRSSPVFDPSQPVSADYEGRLYDYYGRPRRAP